MAPNYNTPGIYTDEIMNFPLLVESVQTSIPCFFGKTEKGFTSCKDDLRGVPTKIHSLAEYESLFGFSDSVKATVLIKLNLPSIATVNDYYNNMYFSVKHYFDNGGGPCYIHSVAHYSEKNITAENYKDELSKLDFLDEATIIVLPDLADLKDSVKAYEVYNTAMQKAAVLKDKFVIIDVYEELHGSKIDALKSRSTFRSMISNNIDSIKYGAAYYPSVKTTYSYDINNAGIEMIFDDDVIATLPCATLLDKFDYIIARKMFTIYATLLVFDDKYFIGIKKDDYEIKKNEIKNRIDALFPLFNEVEQEEFTLGITNVVNQLQRLGIACNTCFNYSDSGEKEKLLDQLKAKIIELYSSARIKASAIETDTYTKLESTFLKKILPFFDSVFEAKLKETFIKIFVVLPASPAVAGIYTTVDRNRGVWKAPANIALASVVRPTILLSDNDQEDFNIDLENGKSINCIRHFVGRGTLVWGGKTLAGTNSEWKYINVRRFFNMIEKSCKNAIRKFVFEQNDSNTWIRVKDMVQIFLTNLWRQGALQGYKREQAFYVSVGLNQTMTQEDILNGIMIVEIGLAVIRPTEFIILKFSNTQSIS